MSKVSYKRHLLKTITWRVIASLSTILIIFILTHNWEISLTFGGVEMIAKMILYFLHERAWYKFSKFGVNNPNTTEDNI